MPQKTTSQSDKDHMRRVAELHCIICSEFLDIYDSPALVHHITTRRGFGGRSKPTETIPLCFEHHDGKKRGVAVHEGVGMWEDNFDTQENLLKRVCERLGVEYEENSTT